MNHSRRIVRECGAVFFGCRFTRGAKRRRSAEGTPWGCRLNPAHSAIFVARKGCNGKPLQDTVYLAEVLSISRVFPPILRSAEFFCFNGCILPLFLHKQVLDPRLDLECFDRLFSVTTVLGSCAAVSLQYFFYFSAAFEFNDDLPLRHHFDMKGNIKSFLPTTYEWTKSLGWQDQAKFYMEKHTHNMMYQ